MVRGSRRGTGGPQWSGGTRAVRRTLHMGGCEVKAPAALLVPRVWRPPGSTSREPVLGPCWVGVLQTQHLVLRCGPRRSFSITGHHGCGWVGRCGTGQGPPGNRIHSNGLRGDFGARTPHSGMGASRTRGRARSATISHCCPSSSPCFLVPGASVFTPRVSCTREQDQPRPGRL